VGPAAMSLRDYLQGLRTTLRMHAAPVLAVPGFVMRGVARLGDVIPSSMFDSAAWEMLQRGSTAPAEPMTRLLGRHPRPIAEFVPPEHAAAHRSDARMGWLLPMLRVSVAFVWIVTGLVSLGVYPVEDSYELLARAGVPTSLQPLMLFGAAALDLVFGVASLLPWRHRRWLWCAQIGLILFYTAVITVRLPEFWLHPYGPVLKNIPMLAALLLLAVFEDPKEKRR
jgi:hypothetical protein